jgi:hypothetical protein
VALGVSREDGLDLHTVLVSLDCLIDYLRDVGARQIQVEGLPDGSEVFQLLLVAPNPLLAVATFQLIQDFLAASENVLLALVSFNRRLLWLDSYWVPVRLHILIKGRSQILLETLREACFQIVTLSFRQSRKACFEGYLLLGESGLVSLLFHRQDHPNLKLEILFHFY